MASHRRRKEMMDQTSGGDTSESSGMMPENMERSGGDDGNEQIR